MKVGEGRLLRGCCCVLFVFPFCGFDLSASVEAVTSVLMRGFILMESTANPFALWHSRHRRTRKHTLTLVPCRPGVAGQHNVAYATTGDREEYKNWAWEDSRLTAKGEDQARALRPVMEKERVDVVIVSTLSRAILTGMLACGTAQPIVATELVRERIGTHPCDKRRSKSALAADFPVLDLSGVGEEVDPLWTPDREPWDALIGRAHEFLRFVMARPEQHVVCVAHNDFFQALFRDSGWVAGDDVRSILFKNCDKHTVLLRHLDENPGK